LPDWLKARPKVKGWAISFWPTFAKLTQLFMCCAVLKTTTLPMSREL
jgi:hypothetical protein